MQKITKPIAETVQQSNFFPALVEICSRLAMSRPLHRFHESVKPCIMFICYRLVRRTQEEENKIYTRG